MTSKYIHDGDVISITATGAVASGALVVLPGAFGGVCVDSVVTGEQLNVAVEGVFEVPKKAAATIDFVVGEKVTLLTTGGVEKAVTAGAGTEALGYAVEAAATGDTTVKVKLCTF